ncbi:hypothetical protein J4Q44_G00179580 [Coregonus suidteri]|uniref:Uncharacterized protein n=1 Tax=Coregonus suidteri TaxID=861788 RepID=A0AAN8LMF9_9TELE
MNSGSEVMFTYSEGGSWVSLRTGCSFLPFHFRVLVVGLWLPFICQINPLPDDAGLCYLKTRGRRKNLAVSLISMLFNCACVAGTNDDGVFVRSDILNRGFINGCCVCAM